MTTAVLTVSPLAALAESFGTLKLRLERYRAYRATRRELMQLSNRELDDIGISRWQIPGIAAAHIYGR